MGPLGLRSEIAKLTWAKLDGYTTEISTYPRHPVIPPEVSCLIGIFLGSSHTLKGGVTGCLGIDTQKIKFKKTSPFTKASLWVFMLGHIGGVGRGRVFSDKGRRKQNFV